MELVITTSTLYIPLQHIPELEGTGNISMVAGVRGEGSTGDSEEMERGCDRSGGVEGEQDRGLRVRQLCNMDVLLRVRIKNETWRWMRERKRLGRHERTTRVKLKGKKGK